MGKRYPKMGRKANGKIREDDHRKFKKVKGKKNLKK